MKMLLGNKIARFSEGAAVTIGNFDGVHLGHQALMSRLSLEAKKRGIPSVVILFEPQPAEYFLKEQAPARLATLREKLSAISRIQVDYVWCLRFNQSLANTSAETFVQRDILSKLHAKYVLLGKDFRFGKARQGDTDLLKKALSAQGCFLEVMPDYLLGGQRVSSTVIRSLLANNQLDQAEHFLGRTYSMMGRVVAGEGRGRQWGIPTANINIMMHRYHIPLSGVFCVRIKRKNGQCLNGVANLGVRPTVSGQSPVLEVHLFDFSDTIYGEYLEIFFLYKLRDEVKFSSIDDLIQQIREDVGAAKGYFTPATI